MPKWLKILIIAIAVIFIGGLILIFATLKKGQPSASSSKPPSATRSASASDQTDFELKKSNANYTVYYHQGDDANADKTLDILSQAVSQFYQPVLGIIPQNTPVYLPLTVDEYVKIADFPGGAQNVQVGDGSAPDGKIYLYKPFENPPKGRGVIIHEGTHAAIYAFLGSGELQQKMPGFLNEGLAYHLEYSFNSGTSYNPIKEIYFSDILRQAAKTNSPPLMSLEELGQNCEGYINDENLNGLCRGQGTFIVWYLASNSGDQTADAAFWQKFLADLKTSDSWQKSLETISGKNLNQLGQEIDANLKSKLD